MKRILVATDFSGRSSKAVRRASLLASRFGVELTVLHVIDEEPDSLIAVEMEASHAILAELAKELEGSYAVSAQPSIRVGAPHEAILAAAADIDAEIIVMGAHRKHILKDVFVGTTIERVMRTGALPVLMVNQEPRKTHEDILLALDLSEASANAARKALSLGFLADARIRIAHAFDPPAKSRLIVGDVAQEKIDAYVTGERVKATSDLVAFAQSLPIDTRTAKLQVVEGDPAPVIMDIAQAKQPDLVVAGTQGRSGLAKFLLGSVAESLLRNLETDILVVPQR